MSKQEFWLSGPIDGIHPLLHPVAHALLQVQQDVVAIVSGLEEYLLWKRIGDAAPIGFHLNHIAGATDRLFTYARGEALNDKQIAAMKEEKTIYESAPSKDELLQQLSATIDSALQQLRSAKPGDLTQPREVGRAKLPSTIIGLLYHAAEHAQRHSGQIATTIQALKE